MDLNFRNVNNTEDINIADGEIVNVKGALFKVVRLSPREIRLEPANSDQVKEYLNAKIIKRPVLSEGTKK